MLNHLYLKLLALALIVPLCIPYLSKVFLYINMLNIVTDHHAMLIIHHINQRFNLELPHTLGFILSLMFWPIIGSIMIDLFYRYILKKPFNQYIICTILLWLLFNCGRFLVH